MKNKRGWIKIVEAAVAVLIVTGVLLVVIQKGYVSGGDSSSEIYNTELAALREIQLKDSLREEIIIVGLPVGGLEWGVGGGASPVPNVDITLNNKLPGYLECKGKVCVLDDECALDIIPTDATNIYAKSVSINKVIGSDPATDSVFRQLKLFCWRG